MPKNQLFFFQIKNKGHKFNVILKKLKINDE